MTVSEIIALVRLAWEYDMETREPGPGEGEGDATRLNNMIETEIRNLQELLLPMTDSDGGTGIILLDPMKWSVNVGGSSGSTELGGANGPETKTGDCKGMASVILPNPQGTGEGHNPVLIDATRQGLAVELWAPEWRIFAEFSDLKDAVKN